MGYDISLYTQDSRDRVFSHLHGGADVCELCCVVPALADDAAPADQVLVVRGVLQVQLALVLVRQPRQHAVEDVVVSLVRALEADSMDKVLLEILLDCILNMRQFQTQSTL